jgi:hypothetical protein
MKGSTARISLAGVFVLSLAIQLGGVSVVHGTMWPPDYQSVVLKLLYIYSIPLGVAVGGILASSKPKSIHVDGGLMWISLGLVILWNSIFLIRTLVFCFSAQDSAKDLIGFYDNISTGSSFLIAAVLAFFFSKTVSGKSITPSQGEVE